MVKIPVILSLVDQKDLCRFIPVKEAKMKIAKKRLTAMVKGLILGR